MFGGCSLTVVQYESEYIIPNLYKVYLAASPYYISETGHNFCLLSSIQRFLGSYWTWPHEKDSSKLITDMVRESVRSVSSSFVSSFVTLHFKIIKWRSGTLVLGYRRKDFGDQME